MYGRTTSSKPLVRADTDAACVTLVSISIRRELTSARMSVYVARTCVVRSRTSDNSSLAFALPCCKAVAKPVLCAYGAADDVTAVKIRANSPVCV